MCIVGYIKLGLHWVEVGCALGGEGVRLRVRTDHAGTGYTVSLCIETCISVGSRTEPHGNFENP